MFASARKSLLVLLLPLLLLFAQQAAAVHAIQHHSDRASQTQKQDAHLPGDQSCEQCFAFAHLSGTTASHIGLPMPAPASFVVVAPRAETIRHIERLTPPSRGPPAFL